MPRTLRRLRTADALQVADLSPSAILFIGETAFDCAPEQAEFLLQHRFARFGQHMQ